MLPPVPVLPPLPAAAAAASAISRPTAAVFSAASASLSLEVLAPSAAKWADRPASLGVGVGRCTMPPLLLLPLLPKYSPMFTAGLEAAAPRARDRRTALATSQDVT